MKIEEFTDIVERALAEDLADGGDLTSQTVIPEQAGAHGNLVARAEGVIAGLEVAEYVFSRVDPTVQFGALVSDGAVVEAGDVVAMVTGPAR
ncbi:MAG TPA: nicotinate-nucleotide diphosphorylase (carboxylating), partial [Acidimicrobiia bacterium]|nr:nicotinate-nucleotide diphosphorylase (carboxylating) [Acidimicrobiia bacterium]